MKSKEIVSNIQNMKPKDKSPMVPAAWDKLDKELMRPDNGFVRPKKNKAKKKRSK